MSLRDDIEKIVSDHWPLDLDIHGQADHVRELAEAVLTVIQAKGCVQELSVIGRLLEDVEDNDVIPGTVLRHDGHELTIHTHGQVLGWFYTQYDEAKARRDRA